MKRYFYKEKNWYYFGFEYNKSLINELERHLKAKYNPANKEFYLQVELWNLSSVQKFIEENGFVERKPIREREVLLSPFPTLITEEDIEILLPELNPNYSLRNYQCEGVSYLINHGNCINGCSAGLGKTRTTIFFAEFLNLFPCIIVCPATVKSGWEREWNTLFPNRSVSVIGTAKKKNWDADVTIINYDLIGSSSYYMSKKGERKRRVELKFPEFQQREYKLIVADEIHLLKNSKAIRSKAFSLLSKNIERIIGLSGTLIMNRPAELQNILRLIKRYDDIFPDWEYFYYRYCNMKITEYGRDTSFASNIDELFEVLSHYCYFRKEKRDVLTELPPIIEQVVEMGISNKKAYKQAEENFIDYLEAIDIDKIEAALKAETLVQLNTLFSLSVNGKLKEMEQYITEWLEANEDEKLLVFGTHKAPLELLASKIGESCLITGDLSLVQKEKEKNSFIQNKDKRVLFANIQCIGTGVDGLQEVCSNGMFIELPMRPSDLEQAIGRLERMGQKSCINIYYLLSPETIDMKLWQVLSDKKTISDRVIKGYDDDVSLGLLKKYRS